MIKLNKIIKSVGLVDVVIGAGAGWLIWKTFETSRSKIAEENIRWICTDGSC